MFPCFSPANVSQPLQYNTRCLLPHPCSINSISSFLCHKTVILLAFKPKSIKVNCFEPLGIVFLHSVCFCLYCCISRLLLIPTCVYCASRWTDTVQPFLCRTAASAAASSKWNQCTCAQTLPSDASVATQPFISTLALPNTDYCMFWIAVFSLEPNTNITPRWILCVLICYHKCLMDDLEQCSCHTSTNTSFFFVLLFSRSRNPKRFKFVLRSSDRTQGFVPLHQLPEARGGVSCPGSSHVSP